MTHEEKATQEIIDHINADKEGHTWNGRIKSALTTYRAQVLEESCKHCHVAKQQGFTHIHDNIGVEEWKKKARAIGQTITPTPDYIFFPNVQVTVFTADELDSLITEILKHPTN